MLIEKIIIKNFRNLHSLTLEPDKKFNVIYGYNAQGKTNILEAIYLIANLKSFRNANLEDFVSHNEQYCYLNGTIVNRNVKRIIEIFIDKNAKQVKLDGKKPTTTKEFYGLFRPILFSPEESFLLKGSPGARRAFLDRSIFQSFPAFVNLIIEYNRLLKQRNKLLKEGKRKQEIYPWTKGLIHTGTCIRLERLNYLNNIIPILKDTFHKITEGKETIDIVFNFSESSYDALFQFFENDLFRLEQREKNLGQTLSGPHRDDPVFLLNGHPIRQFGSQGQLRSLVLAFKVAQIVDIEKIIGEPPVLLLDDMTGELDAFRQKYLFDFLLSQKGQVFITTTDIKSQFYKMLDKGRFFLIDNGEIRKIATNKEIYD